MSQAIPDKYRDLFSKRAFASLGTLMPDGSPQVTPVWCDLEGDLVETARQWRATGPLRGPRDEKSAANTNPEYRWFAFGALFSSRRPAGNAGRRRAPHLGVRSRCLCASVVIRT